MVNQQQDVLTSSFDHVRVKILMRVIDHRLALLLHLHLRQPLEYAAWITVVVEIFQVPVQVHCKEGALESSLKLGLGGVDRVLVVELVEQHGEQSLAMFPIIDFGCAFTTSRLSGEMLASLQYSLMVQLREPGFDDGSLPERRWLKADLQASQLI